MWIESAWRYPVKGTSGERLARVQAEAGEVFPGDRQFALLRSAASFEPSAPAWLPKTHFLMLMQHEALATLHARYDADLECLTITHAGSEQRFEVGSAEGRACAEAYFQRVVPGARPRWVSGRQHSFSDKAEKYVSLINLATLRELERRWSTSLHPLRFRANVYIDGAAPFSELEWVGRQLRLGGATALVRRRNGRCAATNVDPLTGMRDRDVPGRLRAEFGHKDLGVYLSVTSPGSIADGDRIELLESAPVEPPSSAAPLSSRAFTPQTSSAGSQWICSSCYYLLPAGVEAAAEPPVDDASLHLPASYGCPDCGADASRVVARAQHRPMG